MSLFRAGLVAEIARQVQHVSDAHGFGERQAGGVIRRRAVEFHVVPSCGARHYATIIPLTARK